MERGDIYLVSQESISGHEQQGTRPVMVVPPSAFNQLTKAPACCQSLTGAGTSTTGVVRCYQSQALDLASCKARKTGNLVTGDHGENTNEAQLDLRVKATARRSLLVR